VVQEGMVVLTASERVREATGETFRWQNLPNIRVKGKTELITLFQLNRESRQRGIQLSEPRYLLPMIGRTEELDHIREKMALVLKGKGQIIGVTAEAGMGKSRLAAEVIRLAQEQGFESYGAVGIRGKEVSHIDVDRVLDSARAVYVPLDREVLHVIPTGYIVDGQNGIKDPVGMFGVRLEANVYIITGAVTSIQNLIKCCEKTGIQVRDLVFEPFASAEAILTDYERDLGVAVVDIGGGTTDITIFKDGCLRHSSVLAVGGNHFTNDIAIGLRISVAEAERIKRSFGSAIASTVSETEEIDIIQAEKERKILRRHLAEIIQPRTVELLNLIKDELKSVSGYDIASSGVVITGGGSLLQGFDRIAEIVLELPVRIGSPRDIRGCEEIIANPIYATGAGLVLYGYRGETSKAIETVGITGIVGKMKDLVKGFFK